MKHDRKAQMVALIREFGAEIHGGAITKGWWADRDELSKTKPGKVQVDIGCIALAVTELAEAIENIRAGEKPDDKVPEFTGLEAEIADCIIRLLDFSAARNLRVPEAMVAKVEVNKGRPVRHGGKLA